MQGISATILAVTSQWSQWPPQNSGHLATAVRMKTLQIWEEFLVSRCPYLLILNQLWFIMIEYKLIPRFRSEWRHLWLLNLTTQTRLTPRGVVRFRSQRWCHSDLNLSIAPTGELWSVFCEYLGERWPCYKECLLYITKPTDTIPLIYIWWY